MTRNLGIKKERMYDKDTFGIILSFMDWKNGQDIMNLMITNKNLLDIGLQALESLDKSIYITRHFVFFERNDVQLLTESRNDWVYIFNQDNIFRRSMWGVGHIMPLNINKVDKLECDEVLCCLDSMIAFNEQCDSYIKIKEITFQQDGARILSDTNVYSDYKCAHYKQMSRNKYRDYVRSYLDTENMVIMSMYNCGYKFYFCYSDKLVPVKKFSR